MSFLQLRKTKVQNDKDFYLLIALIIKGVSFIMLINVKMPTIVGILRFISIINLMLS